MDSLLFVLKIVPALIAMLFMVIGVAGIGFLGLGETIISFLYKKDKNLGK